MLRRVADGLGVPTLRALNTVNIARGFEVGMAAYVKAEIAIIVAAITK